MPHRSRRARPGGESQELRFCRAPDGVRIATVIRYDERGYGLSDWDVADLSLAARVGDLEAVADAAGLERFALLGMSQGGPVAIAYTAQNPDRVTRLALSATHPTPVRTPDDEEQFETLVQLVRVTSTSAETAIQAAAARRKVGVTEAIAGVYAGMAAGRGLFAGARACRRPRPRPPPVRDRTRRATTARYPQAAGLRLLRAAVTTPNRHVRPRSTAPDR